ncbi:MAG: hypothetical protein OFPI_00670 [Osedax symbiont Rs2]|nr:MAG: hypothetical protein OFPI_00670 [Osedax symbiont Rs2]
MSVLLRLKDYVTVEEASVILTDVLQEGITEEDIINLAESNKLKLCMEFHEVEYLNHDRQHLQIEDNNSVDKDDPDFFDLVFLGVDLDSIQGVWDICRSVNLYDLFCHSKGIERFKYDDPGVDLMLRKGNYYLADDELPFDPLTHHDDSNDYRILNKHPHYDIIISKIEIDLLMESYLNEKKKYTELTINTTNRGQLSVSNPLLESKQEKINGLQAEVALLDKEISRLKKLQSPTIEPTENNSLGVNKEKNLHKTIGSLTQAMLHYGPSSIKKSDGSLNKLKLAELLEERFPPKNPNGCSARAISTRINEGFKHM